MAMPPLALKPARRRPAATLYASPRPVIEADEAAPGNDDGGRQQLAGEVEEARRADVGGVGADGGNSLPCLDGAGGVFAYGFMPVA